MRPLLPFLVLAGCVEATAEELPGVLAHLTVTTTQPGCGRPDGDGGVQFFARRPDGGLVFTVSQQVQFGPLADGGALEGVQRQTLPPVGGGAATVGSAAGCAGVLAGWVEDPGTGDLELTQSLPGRQTECPDGPDWLPATRCETVRRFTFTPLADCDLRCVRLSAAPEVTCACP